MNIESMELIGWLQRIKQKFKDEVPQQNYYKPMKAGCSIIISEIRRNTKLYAGRTYAQNQQRVIDGCSGRYFLIVATFLREELDT